MSDLDAPARVRDSEDEIQRRDEGVGALEKSDSGWVEQFADTVIFLHRENLSSKRIDPAMRAEIEKVIRKKAESDPKWGELDLDTAIFLHSNDFTSELADFDSEWDRWVEHIAGMSHCDAVLSEGLSSAEWGQMNRSIRTRIKERERNNIEKPMPSMSESLADEADISSEFMYNIGDYFAQAGDYLRLGILGQKTQR